MIILIHDQVLSPFFPDAITHLLLTLLVFIFLAISSFHRLDRLLDCSNGTLTFLQSPTSLPSSPPCKTMPYSSPWSDTHIRYHQWLTAIFLTFNLLIQAMKTLCHQCPDYILHFITAFTLENDSCFLFYVDSFIKCLLSIYYVPGLVLSVEMSINKQTDQEGLNSPGVFIFPLSRGALQFFIPRPHQTLSRDASRCTEGEGGPRGRSQWGHL